MRGEQYRLEWSPLVDLGCAALGGALVWLLPQAAPLPLVLAGLPWLWRIMRRHFPFRRTPLDLPIAFFLLTALVGAWASYDRPAALGKLWILVGAIFIYYAIARQPHQNLWLVYAFLSGSGALISLYFLFTYDWHSMPADLTFIQTLGTAWASLRPRLPGAAPHPNIAGGLIALMTPFTLASLWDSWKNHQRKLAFFTLVSGGIATVGLMMSSSRAAWLVLGLGLGSWLLWGLAGRLHRGNRWSHSQVFIALSILCLAIGALVLIRYPGGIIGLIERLPGLDSTASRMEIARGTLRLIRDFPYTGGGLHSFAGLYSHYIVSMPFFLFNYAHNLYLDLALEQGLAGLASFLIILAVTAWQWLRHPPRGTAYGAALAGLVILAAHGLADDPLYSGRGTPFLFLAPALVFALTHDSEAQDRRPVLESNSLYVAATLLILVLLNVVFYRPLLSAFNANFGAVHMARVDLVDFPSGEFDDGSHNDALPPAERLFESALAFDPDNFTALYRLGLVNLLRKDFLPAQAYLERAFAIDPRHSGVAKNLAFCYVWNGEYEQASAFMQGGSGISRELEAYVSWWQIQGRPDLSEKAEAMLARLR